MGLPQVGTVHFEKTDTKEFNELNTTLNTMVNKIHSDYETMKQFTEDAAHEMQTPLAVAQTKLELLLQDANLSNAQTETIIHATTALNRLSKLNQSLLLLAKIENQQYEPTEMVDLAEVARKYVRLFDEIIREKQLSLETVWTEPFEVRLHPLLADSLISNLVGNAVKYNIGGGRLVIAVDQTQFCISNTSLQGAMDPQLLFKRFSSSSGAKNNSTGLGLAIIKKIADTNRLVISYRFVSEMQSFCLTRPTS